jgi:hypothetical protein
MSIDKAVSDFMSAFISSPEPEIDHEYYQIEAEYSKMFGHTVPRAMLPDSITMDSIKTAMKTCIERKQDTLFELLGVKINNNYLY